MTDDDSTFDLTATFRNMSDAEGCAELMKVHAERSEVPFEPATLTRGLSGIACAQHILGGPESHTVALLHHALTSTAHFPIRGAGIFIGAGGLLVAGHTIAGSYPQVAPLIDSARLRTRDQAAKMTDYKTDWALGWAGLLHFAGKTSNLPVSESQLDWLNQQTRALLKDVNDRQLVDTRPLSHAHGLAGMVAALSVFNKYRGEAVDYAWSIIDLAFNVDTSNTPWMPASWCGGHVGIAAAGLEAAIEADCAELAARSWDLFRFGLDHGKYVKDELSLCHGLGGTTAIAFAFSQALEWSEVRDVHQQLLYDLRMKIERVDIATMKNIELATGISGALVAANLEDNDLAGHFLNLVFGIPVGERS